MRLFTLCAYLKTKESYDRWVTRRVWGFDIKYLKQNISRCRSEISGSFRRNSVALYTERKTLRVSAIRGSGHVCSGKLKRPPLPSGCEISRCEMSANGIPDVNVDGRNSSPRVEWAMSQGGPSACARCRDPSGLTPSRFPKRTCAAMLSSTCEHHTPDDSISYPDMLSESLTTVSKPYYSPRSAALPMVCPDALSGHLFPWIPKNSPQSRIALVIKKLSKHQNLTQFD